MPEWNDTFNTFREQFAVQGPEKYKDLDNPDLRYELASQREAAKSGAAVASGAIAKNVNEAQQAADAKKQQGYTRKYNKAGGYTFLNPDGTPVSAFEYALAKGVPITAALEGSYDPSDVAFLQDMSGMMVDLSQGKYEYTDAIDMLSKDYPSIFAGAGSPNGGAGFSSFRKEAGIKQAEGAFGGLDPKSKDRSEKLLADFMGKVRGFGSYNDAFTYYQGIISSKDFSKLKKKDSAAAKQLQDSIESVLDTVYPPSNQSLMSKSYPFY